jgi:hypothetical protein
MNWAETLWDVLSVSKREPRSRGRSLDRAAIAPMRAPAAVAVIDAPANGGEHHRDARSLAMQDRYDALVREMKQVHGIRVRKWRKSSSGVAWMVRYADGKTVKLIESPYPRGPMSCAIFLHEVGHHVIGLGVHKPRCLEEHVVWEWAIGEMRRRGFNVTPAVEKRVRDSMRYAVAKAKRRGIHSVPAELHQFI